MAASRTVQTRPQPDHRRRSLITVAALTALGKTEQLRFHICFARTNGLTTTELTEAITHLAFYSGWPNGMGAMAVAKQVLDAGDSDGDSDSDSAGDGDGDGEVSTG